MSTNPLLPDTRPGSQTMEHYSGFGTAKREEITFGDVTRILRRQRRIIVYAVMVCLAIALLVSLFMTPKYTAVANIELNAAEGNKLGLSDFSMDPNSGADELGTNLSTLMEMLSGDTLALETIDQNHLESVPPYIPPQRHKYEVEAGLPLAQAPERRTRILKKFESNLSVKPVPGTRLLKVSFADRDAKRSAAVLNSLIDNYNTDYIHRHYSSAVQASAWLQKQLADLKQQVAVSEAKVTDYAKQNGFYGYVGTGAENAQSPLLQKLITLNQSVVQAEAERIQKEAIVRMLETNDPEVIVGLGANPQIANGVTGTDLAVLQSLHLQEAQLKAQYSDMEIKYGPRYPALIETKNQLNSVEQSILKTVNNLRARVQNDYAIAAKNETMLKQTFDEQAVEANRLNDKATQFQLLTKEAEANRDLYEALRTKLREAEVAASVRGSNITVVDPGLPTPKPSTPNYPLNLAIGLGGGLLIGLGAAFYRSRGDQTLETVEAMEALSPVPILGAVPSLSRLKQPASPRNLSGVAPKVINGRLQQRGSEDKLATEAYRQIRTSILLSGAGAAPRTILVTSPLNGDGKSNSVFELASAFASGGARVLALDCDLRHSDLDGRLGQAADPGLSELLEKGGNPDQFIHPFQSIPNLFLLSSGNPVDSPLILLESPRFKQLLEELKTSFDFILIDSPPVSFFADVSVMAPLMDATVLVVRAGVTSRQAFRRSCTTLLDARTKLLGVVVNDLALDSASFYGYYGYRGKDFARSYAKI